MALVQILLRILPHRMYRFSKQKKKVPSTPKSAQVTVPQRQITPHNKKKQVGVDIGGGSGKNVETAPSADDEELFLEKTNDVVEPVSSAELDLANEDASPLRTPSPGNEGKGMITNKLNLLLIFCDKE